MQTTETPRTGDIDGWVERALACVSCDGTVDERALDAVEFAHNLAVARTVVASTRDAIAATPSQARRLGDITLGGIRIPNERKSGRLSVLALALPTDSGEWYAHPGWRAGVDGWSLTSSCGPALPPQDDIVAALVAFSAKSRTCPFQISVAFSTVSERKDTWLWRVANALVRRSAPWDLSAVDQEIGLARVLMDRLIAWSDTRADSAPCRIATDHLSADDAAAYKAATAVWHTHRLAFNAKCMPAPTLCSPLLCGLSVFIAAAERMQATPGFYLHFVAPAIAARLQPGLDALADPQTAPRAGPLSDGDETSAATGA
ncbi:hypothetical protein pqer_cds_535 [Pandoravirus quercus]|uniref:Uncharacterized protein n=2 Tax=Pandoravirus TaxID=2060084 RepID=A0A2U7U936_9VIRU|nr:hypothetical protein pqer_cds_535 [Pandoravirus quercus]AVK74957.1 hypothetical protein pqer_cds_535 [Pandoravirus quercus]QBZ81143.1 hypothetical protein pclt_cds_550 [Pandoravirus celtis]